MGKIKRVTRDGDLFTMEVELERGHRELWTYEIQEHDDDLRSYVMILREQTR